MRRVALYGRSVAAKREARWPLLLAMCVIFGGALSPLVSDLAAQQAAESAAGRPLVSIKELMEKTITPATNTIWGAYDPPADEAEWIALE